MSDLQKPDAEEFRSFFQTLASRDWIKNSERQPWPRFAFHYSDLRNAVEVLKAGSLFSRLHIEQELLLPVSSGSSRVLARTDKWIKDSVRLYFRPNTPTQFHTEGVKSRSTEVSAEFRDAHCPVPVFFLFDLASVLALPATKFSDRGLGAHRYTLYEKAADLAKLDWEKIYHIGPIKETGQERKEIVACENAEVIVPHALSLTFLKFVFCRSSAELETLRFLLPETVASVYSDRMYSSSKRNLFTRKHTYLERVQLSANVVACEFSPETASPGPFVCQIQFTDLEGNTLREESIPNFFVHDDYFSYRWKIPTPSSEYAIRIYLDDALIYANRHRDTGDYY